KEQLRRVMDLCHESGLFEISGEDINSPRQSFICPALADPAYAHLREATYALIGHEKAATANLADAMFAPGNTMSLEDKIKKYAKIGGYEG
ncbi:MAG: PHP domain-containing protein, partial [Eubacteriales bacterium]